MKHKDYKLIISTLVCTVKWLNRDISRLKSVPKSQNCDCLSQNFNFLSQIFDFFFQFFDFLSDNFDFSFNFILFPMSLLSHHSNLCCCSFQVKKISLGKKSNTQLACISYKTTQRLSSN